MYKFITLNEQLKRLFLQDVKTWFKALPVSLAFVPMLLLHLFFWCAFCFFKPKKFYWFFKPAVKTNFCIKI